MTMSATQIKAVATVLVAGLALVMLQLLSRWMPPLQSPDELSHLVRIASLTEGQWAPVTEPGVSTGGSFDLGLAAIARAYMPVIKDRNHPVPAEDQALATSQRWTGTTLFGEAPGSATVMPLAYAPAALGLALGRALDWTVLESYHLARLSSQFFCVVLMALATWIWRPPLLAWGVMLLPMSLFQLGSPVVDGPAHALTLLSLSLLMRLRVQASTTLALATATALLVLVTIRLHMLPLLLIPLWWAVRSLTASGRGSVSARVAMPDGVARQLLMASVAAAALCGLWVLWVLGSVVDTRVQRPIGTGAVAWHYLSHPGDLWAVASRTLADTDRLVFYAESFVGNLGWLDTRLSESAYEILWWGLGALAVLSLPWIQRPSLPSGDRVLLATCALGAVVMAFALMLLTWTPFPADMVEGVQGRYFIAPALVLAYALGDGPAPAAAERGGGLGPWVQIAALIGFAAVSLWFLIPTLINRYPVWTHGGLWG